MKVLSCLVLVAAIAFVQGRSASIRNEGTPAARGDNPSHVHLRFALSNGQLRSCAGALIHNRWVLTTARCLSDATFTWIRYGALDVSHPALVTEAGAALLSSHQDYDGLFNDIGLIHINRNVEFTDDIDAIALESISDAENSIGDIDAPLCTWGDGEQLTCFSVPTASLLPCQEVGGPFTHDFVCSIGTTPALANSGTPLIVENKLVAMVSHLSNGSNDSVNTNFAVYVRIGKYIRWIEEVTGLVFVEREDVDVAPAP